MLALRKMVRIQEVSGHKSLFFGILALSLITMTACAAIIPQKFYEKTTAKVKVKNESAYSNNGATLSKEPAKNIFEIDIKF